MVAFRLLRVRIARFAWQWPVAGDAVVESVKFFNAVYGTEQTETAEENDYFDPGNKRAISKLQMDLCRP
jgi:hypothetical protein